MPPERTGRSRRRSVSPRPSLPSAFRLSIPTFPPSAPPYVPPSVGPGLGRRQQGRTQPSRSSHPVVDDITGPSPAFSSSRRDNVGLGRRDNVGLGRRDNVGLDRSDTGSLPKKLIREFEALQDAHPYVPYGAHVKRQSQELLQRSKRGQRLSGQEWNLRNTFSDDELRLMLTDNIFAKKMLKAYDPAFKDTNPSAEDITRFRERISNNEGARIYQHLRPGDRYPEVQRDLADRIKETANQRISLNENLASQAAMLLENSSRLAPLSDLHTSAKELIQRNDPTESLRLGRQEINLARRTNIPNSIRSYLRSASEEPQPFLDRYNNIYNERVINNFRREAARDFLENDLPRINGEFASRGAFYGGAREAAIQKARERKEQRIESEIARLLHTSHEEGMKHFHNQRGHHLKQAEVVGHAHQAQNDSSLRAAEHLRVNSNEEQRAIHQKAMALEQMGRTEQQQKQNELNVRQQEHREEMERPFERQAQKAALVQGVHYPKNQLSPESINPAPPNIYGMASGLVGQMAGLMGQQQQAQARAKGGHVRKGYAGGDSVKRAASQLLDMTNHIQETPEEAEMRASAQNFKNYKDNPMADYLFTLGSHQLANPNKNPMESYGEGSLLGMQAYKSSQANNLSAQEKYNNLIGKINQTKMYQQEFLAKHHANMLNNEEIQRHHQAKENESRRYHNMMDGLSSEKLKSFEGPPKLSAVDKRLESDARKDMLRAMRMKKELGHLDSLVKKTSSGPIAGRVKSLLPKTKIDNQIEVTTNKLILDMHQGMKNIPRSEEFMKRIETTKPNINNHPEANQQALSLMGQGADDVRDNSITTLLSLGWTPEQIERKFKVNIPSHLLEESEGDSDNSMDNHDEFVSMIDEEGNPFGVPKNEIEDVLKLGGKLVQ